MRSLPDYTKTNRCNDDNGNDDDDDNDDDNNVDDDDNDDDDDDDDVDDDNKIPTLRSYLVISAVQSPNHPAAASPSPWMAR
jgi:hypothetical protein